MNSFERRQQKRKLKRSLIRGIYAFSKILDAAGVQRFFEDGFIQVYGLTPSLIYRKGWFYLQGKRYSRSELLQLARELYAKLHEWEMK